MQALYLKNSVAHKIVSILCLIPDHWKALVNEHELLKLINLHFWFINKIG